MTGKIKVLMVDDEKRFRTATKKILKRKGFKTILAGTGEEAIEKLKEKPDVVILDFSMPGMNGSQVLKVIKERIPGLPVIMLTGQGEMPDSGDLHGEKPFDCLFKPCDINLLSVRIYEAWRQRNKDKILDEKRIIGVMVPFMEYTTVNGNQSVKEAIEILQESFVSRVSTSRIMETGHRSVLVMDDDGKVQGMLTIKDILTGITNSCLSSPDSQYSVSSWKGVFTEEVMQLGKMKVREIMSPAPRTIDGKSSLMEAAVMMMKNNLRRLVVVMGNRVLGVIREQDLFFEMEKTLRENQ